MRKKSNLACGGEFYPGLLLHLRLLSYLALQAVNLLLLLPEKEKKEIYFLLKFVRFSFFPPYPCCASYLVWYFTPEVDGRSLGLGWLPAFTAKLL